jgi:hypothetical protein
MTWALTGSKAASEMIGACNRFGLSGMIERIQASKPQGIDDQVIHALDLRRFQNAQCTEAHGAKSNDGNDTRRPAKSLEASAFLARSRVGPRKLQALRALFLAQGEKISPLLEPLTANWWVTHGVSRDRKARRRRAAHAQKHMHKSPVVRLSLKNRRRAF